MSTQLKSIAVDFTQSGATSALELGDTPFFPGTTCILDTGVVIPTSTTVTIQTAATDSAYDEDWTTIATVTAGEGPNFDIGPLDKWIRANVTDTGTGSAQFAFIGSF